MLTGMEGNDSSTLCATILANKHNISWHTKDGIQQPNYIGSVLRASTVSIDTEPGSWAAHFPPSTTLTSSWPIKKPGRATWFPGQTQAHLDHIWARYAAVQRREQFGSCSRVLDCQHGTLQQHHPRCQWHSRQYPCLYSYLPLWGVAFDCLCSCLHFGGCAICQRYPQNTFVPPLVSYGSHRIRSHLRIPPYLHVAAFSNFFQRNPLLG